MEAMVEGIGRLLGEPDALEAAQSEAVRFVKEWHENAANVASFLNGLRPRPVR
jgi:hypothetical protein